MPGVSIVVNPNISQKVDVYDFVSKGLEVELHDFSFKYGAIESH